uniref:Uncharacterized protein n=1 Tax=Chrysotila carterae TaxID=13221 RepID=A0A7S4AXU8_CHRCT
MASAHSVLLCAALSIALLWLLFPRHVNTPAAHESTSKVQKRAWPKPPPDYCSARFTGEEGVGPEDLHLRGVALVIRHGDRSSIHRLTSEPTSWRCEATKGSAAADALSVIAKGFDVRRLNTGERLARVLRSAAAANGDCEPGQLTPSGIVQHLTLGKHLSRAYAEILPKVGRERAAMGPLAPLPVYVRSTDYTRTLLSACALLVGLLRAESFGPAPPSRISIDVETNEAVDVMHGVGPASSSKVRGDGGGERQRAGLCAVAALHAARQQASIVTTAPLRRSLLDVFGNETGAAPTTHIADALYARACHGLPPPCTPRGCVSPSLVTRVWRDADSVYCRRFAGADGGLAASKLSMLPLLRTITSKLTPMLSSPTAPRIALFSGHDTVVAPLLAALSALSAAPGACRWPPYASHVAFEVWHPRHAFKAARNRTANNFVRIVFNGFPITQYVDGCDDEFCPFPSFMATIDALEAYFRDSCPDAISTLAVQPPVS